jgi:tRNA (guanine37-N1)-methyltransferase
VRLASVLAGEKRTTTTYRENGCSFKVDLAKAYFSTRLGFERKRIADLVKPGENVLVLFAGVGPFAVPIARKLQAAKGAGGRVVAVEWNPYAARMLEFNAGANHVSQTIQAIEEDAGKVVAQKGMARWANRIVMPLLHESVAFFPKALLAAAPGCVIHTYGLVPASKDSNGLKEKGMEIELLGAEAGRKCKVVDSRLCGAYAPRVQQAVFDVLVK